MYFLRHRVHQGSTILFLALAWFKFKNIEREKDIRFIDFVLFILLSIKQGRDPACG